MGVRDSWIEKREAAAAASNGNDHGTHGSQGRNVSQMHFARQSVITEEMETLRSAKSWNRS